MESMCGKFPLANRPKMTRRKRKNLNLAPGASSTTSNISQRGGSSPTTEPVDALEGAVTGMSSCTQSPVASLSVPGPHRRAKGTKQARKRGGNPYSWMSSNDNPSSPTTDEALPITPRSVISSTFSASPPPQASQLPQSPIFGRRNAISAGPRETQFELLPDTRTASFAPISAPLIPTHTWPHTMVEEAWRSSGQTLGRFICTRSDGTVGAHDQAFNHRPNAELGQPSLGAPTSQLALPYGPNPSYTVDGSVSNAPGHYFNQSSGARTTPSSLAGYTFNCDSPGLSSAVISPSIVTYSGSYSVLNETIQVHDPLHLGPPSIVGPSSDGYPRDSSERGHHVITQLPHGNGHSLASLAFNHV
ncbi:hypothetical protein RSOLAG1IB_06630 [Rhizoctonia solani AG-1 IB]|uniref:Uncharacterized protein n=1 Tax=Thanatephorus cucumeris (strain AG1-IB / isolate 7/3/14) TaxID=1108050 RepID=A0A0B7FA90_THACB|nr:hypothetical protein RSOLAG1IB_06630 [Rhizoctonia solani AG-1 IB]